MTGNGPMKRSDISIETLQSLIGACRRKAERAWWEYALPAFEHEQ